VANTRDLKRRIRSVKNTSQLTRAMKMVSAAKLRRAQDAMMHARPFADAMMRVLDDVGRLVSQDVHPLLDVREVKTIDLVAITGDKGLCGAFNAGILRATDGMVAGRKRKGADVNLVLMGRKGVEYYRRRPQYSVIESRQEFFRDIQYTLAQEIADILINRFVAGESDAVYLSFNAFKSTMSQTPVISQLLPLRGLVEKDEQVAREAQTEYIYEPDAKALMAQILPRYVGFQIYRALLESAASEHAARMTAMDSATRNAREMIDKLTLAMNRARQAAITTEIIEVVSGAAAL